MRVYETMNPLDKCSTSIPKKEKKSSWLISSNEKVEFSLMMSFWIRSWSFLTRSLDLLMSTLAVGSSFLI